mmetsp:Transcript_140852/g.449438  ORF Transcript_140852/g.449438 Transcript_140852/m.449438 type:complete len:205 (+) Transcript_140852:199-813(+)
MEASVARLPAAPPRIHSLAPAEGPAAAGCASARCAVARPPLAPAEVPAAAGCASERCAGASPPVAPAASSLGEKRGCSAEQHSLGSELLSSLVSSGGAASAALRRGTCMGRDCPARARGPRRLRAPDEPRNSSCGTGTSSPEAPREGRPVEASSDVVAVEVSAASPSSSCMRSEAQQPPIAGRTAKTEPATGYAQAGTSMSSKV